MPDPPKWPDVQDSFLIFLSRLIRYLSSYEESQQGAFSGSVSVQKEDKQNG